MRLVVGALATRVCVVGGGTAGLAAVQQLKKLGDFHVTLLEAHTAVGGITRTTQYGTKADWNGGQVDSGWVVASRPLYPNYFAFVDEAGLKTERRVLDAGYQMAPSAPVVNEMSSLKHELEKRLGIQRQALRRQSLAELQAEEASTIAMGERALTESLLRAGQQNLTDFGDAASDDDDADPFIDMAVNGWNMQADFDLLTVDPSSSADHLAGALAFLNVTGTGYQDFPLDGRSQWAEAAAARADRVLTGATVTRISRGDQPRVAWTANGEAHEEPFDQVVTTVLPGTLRQVLSGLSGFETRALADLAKTENDILVQVHKSPKLLTKANVPGALPYYHIMPLNTTLEDGASVINCFANGAKPPFVTFWPASDDATRKVAAEFVPPQDVYEEYLHKEYAGTENVEQLKQLLRSLDGVGGVHIAGVWTGNARFGEAAFVSGMRSAMNIANVDPARFAFPSACAARSFRRYALWYQGVAGRDSAVHPECFAEVGLVPPFFDSLQSYEQMVERLGPPVSASPRAYAELRRVEVAADASLSAS